MKDFDLNKIGKSMPYEAPSKDFFDNFTSELLAKVETKQKKKFSLKYTLTPIFASAAAIAIFLTIALNQEPHDQKLSEQNLLSESIDSYLDELSDDELNLLATESSFSDDFFTNLPNN